MKIISIQAENKTAGWSFDKIDFHSNLALLVGHSGVGKTQIIRTIYSLHELANGQPNSFVLDGLAWTIHFASSSGNEYAWEGKYDSVELNGWQFSAKRFYINNDEGLQPDIEFEKLCKNGQTLFERKGGEIIFMGAHVPKLSAKHSLIHLLKEESIIQEALDVLKHIILKDNTEKSVSGAKLGVEASSSIPLESYQTLEDVRNSREHINVKLFLCFRLNLPIWKAIKQQFQDIFPQVEDLEIIQIEIPEKQHLPFPISLNPVIRIKEHGVAHWIEQQFISSGMLRTLIHISEILLANPGAIMLIDEFENSLGINCLDILTENLVHENSEVQFIATSHHPYIINNIPYENWKIVTRKGGRISVRDASEFKLGKSKQAAFSQLHKVLDREIVA